MRKALRIVAVLLAFALGLSGAAYAVEEDSEEGGSPSVDSAPPGDHSDADEAATQDEGAEAED